jgi:hypothetical protein
MDSRHTTGGILKLREIIAEHTSEIAYDFRNRFNLSIFDVGDEFTWLEAVHLVAILLRDMASWTHASVVEWDYPVSREWIVSAHTYDLLAAVNTKKKPKPYPAPWPEVGTNKIGGKIKQDRKTVIERLRQMNPKEE